MPEHCCINCNALLIAELVVWSPAPPVHMSKWPWARHWTPIAPDGLSQRLSSVHVDEWILDGMCGWVNFGQKRYINAIHFSLVTEAKNDKRYWIHVSSFHFHCALPLWEQVSQGQKNHKSIMGLVVHSNLFSICRSEAGEGSCLLNPLLAFRGCRQPFFLQYM